MKTADEQLLARLRRRAMGAKTAERRAFWTRALLRARARLGVWDNRFLNGHAGNITPEAKKFLLRAHTAGLVCTSTSGGQHTATSFHFTKPNAKAVDVGLRGPEIGTIKGLKKMSDFQLKEAKNAGRYLELFGPVNGACVKNGQRITLAEGADLENLHDNHVHGAPKF
jgi:hypothetical protein